jgi:hypothetical protein
MGKNKILSEDEQATEISKKQKKTYRAKKIVENFLEEKEDFNDDDNNDVFSESFIGFEPLKDFVVVIER